MNNPFVLLVGVMMLSLQCVALDMADEGWPKEGNDQQARCISTKGEYNPCMPDVQQIWKNEDYMDVGLWGSPVIVGNNIYLPTDDAERDLACHKLSDGSLSWGADLHDWANGIPVVAEDGTVFVGDYTGFVYRISSSGSIIWETKLPNRMAMNGMVLMSNRVFCMFGNTREDPKDIGGIACLNAENGTNIWTWRYSRIVAWAGGAPPLSPDGSVLYVHSDRTEVAGINTKTGTLEWRYYRPGGQEGHPELQPIVDSQGNIYQGFAGNPFGVGDGNTENDTIVKISRSSGLLWAAGFKDLDFETLWAKDVWDTGGYALSADETVIYTATRGDQTGGGVHAYDTSNGKQNWAVWEDPVDTNNWMHDTFSGVGNINGGIAVGPNRMIYGVASGVMPSVSVTSAVIFPRSGL